MLFKLLSNMDQNHFNNTVVSMTTLGQIGQNLNYQGISTLDLNMSRTNPSFPKFYRLLQIIKTYNPHVLQTWFYHADLLGLIAGKLSSVPSIVWNIRCAELSKNDHSFTLWCIRSLLTKLSPLTNAVVVNSIAGKKAHEKIGYQPPQWTIIPNGFDLDVFKPSESSRSHLRKILGVEEDTFLIGLIARFHPMKDHFTFIKSATIIHKSHPDIHFVLVGKGMEETNLEIQKKVFDLPVKTVLHMLGERTDIPMITAGLDVACCSSYSEGFPNIIGEAMSCGISCVSTDVGDCSKIMEDLGILVPPRNPEELARGIQYFLSMNYDERKKIGLKARDRINQLYNIKNIAQQYEKLYDELTSPTV